MKRLFATLTALFSLISMSSFATGPETVTVTPTVLESFNSSFKNVSNVSWTVGSEMYKANFSLNGQQVTAFFNPNGDMLAITRNICSTQLPLSLQTGLKQRYSEYWISDLFEVASEEGTAYYITIEDGDSKLVLKSAGTEWSTFQKQRKS